MIYFVQSKQGFIKIGTAIDVDSRLSNLQTASPTTLKIKAVLEGSYQTEKGLHELFEHIRYKGEWFKYNDELKYFIRAIRSNPSENNIYSLYRISQQIRITEKANRLSKRGNKKLLERINKINARHSSQ
jgi:hypothetical protein